MRDRVEGLGDVEYSHHASKVRLHAGQDFSQEADVRLAAVVNPICLANRMNYRSLTSMMPVKRRASINPMGLQLRTSVAFFSVFGMSIVLFFRHIRGK